VSYARPVKPKRFEHKNNAKETINAQQTQNARRHFEKKVGQKALYATSGHGSLAYVNASKDK
jgi:hypothetical protein